MASHLLTGMSGVLRLLTSRTAADDVIAGLVTGPLAEFSARAGILVRAVDGQLALIGSYGYAPADLAAYRAIPVDADLPICRAYREGEPTITSTLASTHEPNGLDDDPEHWADPRDPTPRGYLVSVPLLSQGIAIGCFGFACTLERSWGPRAVGVLDGLGSVVAMWLTHPISGYAPEHAWEAAGPITLTVRQRQVLRLCSEGRSTTEIAGLLMYSESTVKQELQRAMRLLETTDRSVAAQRARLLGLFEVDPA